MMGYWKFMDLKIFRQQPIMGILRGAPAKVINELTHSVISAGLKTIEITMNTPGAEKQISGMIKIAGSKLNVGAGTVLSIKEAETAVDAGAAFLVSPILILEVAEFCDNKNILYFPGAFTPREVYEAWQARAAMVKIFPATFFGPKYFKELKGPFSSIELLACSGVKSDNIRSFFESGASAVAFGASIFKKEWLEESKFSLMEEQIKLLISAYRNK